jgi:hypothetical protein
MKLEQRIGRVDRIGQKHDVRVVNFVLDDTVEFRVREVIEEKLAIIKSEFGIDKTGDVLDSAQAANVFDNLYIDAILNPQEVENKIDSLFLNLRDQAKASREIESIFGLKDTKDTLDHSDAQHIMQHPLQHWVEQMTINYLKSYSGKAEKEGLTWNITFPTGETVENAVFTTNDAEADPSAQHLTIENPQIRGLVMHLPRFVQGQPIPSLALVDLSASIKGFWSLWELSIYTPEWNRRRVFPHFLHDDGRDLLPTARFIWDQLLSSPPEIKEFISGENATFYFDIAKELAIEYGKGIYDDLRLLHSKYLEKEQKKKEYAFSARRRMVERIGLPSVKMNRLVALQIEEKAWQEQFRKIQDIYPEMSPLLLLRIEGRQNQ